MTDVRAYLPAVPADLRALIEAGTLAAAGRMVCAVSPTLRTATPRADDEEREDVAFVEAVAAAAQIADGSPRMVLAVDVPQAAIAWSGRGAEGALTVGLVRRDLVSIHVDDTPGDQLARLSWYDATEAAHVLDNVS